MAGAIRTEGGSVRFQALDVTRRKNMQGFVDFAEAEFGHIEVIVNNAGAMPLSPLASLEIDVSELLVHPIVSPY